MVKAVDRGMRIEGIRLIEKRGGRSGTIAQKSYGSNSLDLGRRGAPTGAGARGAPARRAGAARPSRRPRAGRGPQALRTQPPADLSAMDGYAVRASDVARRRCGCGSSARSRPGGPSRQHVGPGEAVRIFTGGAVPDGADAIVIQEHTDRRDGEIVEDPGSPRQRPPCASARARLSRAGEIGFSEGVISRARDLSSPPA